METVLVNLGGVLLIGLIAWWFGASHGRAAPVAAAGGDVEVLVADGVYTPAHIAVPAGQPVRLRFLRRDRSPCAAIVQFPQLGISRELPVDEPALVELPPLAAGRYDFACQMNMYRGTLETT